MSRYTEHYKKMSVELKSWRSNISCIYKKIKRLEEKLAPDLVGHFKGRVYTGITQAKINRLENLKKEIIVLKNNRPEPKMSRKPKTRTKMVKSYTYSELEDKYKKLTKDKKILVLDSAIEIMQSYNGRPKMTCVFMSMGYKLNEETSKWEKN